MQKQKVDKIVALCYYDYRQRAYRIDGYPLNKFEIIALGFSGLLGGYFFMLNM